MQDRWLAMMGLPMREMDVRMMNPLQMAYVGDAVHALFVRTRLFAGGENVGRMHRRSNQCVSAAAQSKLLGQIEPLLTEEEAEIVRRGRNAHAHHAAPKHADPADYSRATALEALLGYLYLTGRDDRLELLLEAASESAGPGA
ncbi:Mini-ribonuclease 3 [Beduinella massiliensis]|uniref:Mini-ribonuclease 3 n=1 Tax=Beduinella massiliensis TaxID=1852363 RepID=UPI0031F853DB